MQATEYGGLGDTSADEPAAARKLLQVNGLAGWGLDKVRAVCGPPALAPPRPPWSPPSCALASRWLPLSPLPTEPSPCLPAPLPPHPLNPTPQSTVDQQLQATVAFETDGEFWNLFKNQDRAVAYIGSMMGCEWGAL